MYAKEKMCAKLHNGTVTGANLSYEGSITIGKTLLDASGIELFDKVQVLNMSNGNRIETYVIEGEGSEICLNGAAAHLFKEDDNVIVIAYMLVFDGRLSSDFGKIADVDNHHPQSKIIILDGTKQNLIKQTIIKAT